MISDGQETYSVFSYNCDELEWTGTPFASVGFSVSGRTENFRNFENYVLSRRPEVGMVACNHTKYNVPWTNIIYRIGVSVTPEQLSRSRCLAQVAADEQKFGRGLTGVDLPFFSDCPCSAEQARRDRRFRRIRGLDVLGENVCFFSRFLRVVINGIVRYRCCYNKR